MITNSISYFLLFLLTITTITTAQDNRDFISGRISIPKEAREEASHIVLHIRALESKRIPMSDELLHKSYLTVRCSLNSKFSFFGLPTSYGLPEYTKVISDSGSSASISVGKGIKVTHSYLILPSSPNYEWESRFVNITHIYHTIDKDNNHIALKRSRQSPSSLWLSPKAKINFDSTVTGPSFIESAKKNPMVYSGLFALVMIFIYPYLNETAQAEKKKLKEEMRLAKQQEK